MVKGEGLHAVIAGGGKVAFRKAKILSDAGAEITVIAPEVSESFSGIKCRIEKRRFKPEDVKGAQLVIAATNSRSTNAEIAAAAKLAGIPVNAADSKEESTVIFPAVTKNAGVKISVSTLGKCPYLAKKIRDELEKRYARLGEELLNRLEKRRKEEKRYGSSGKGKKPEYFYEVLQKEINERICLKEEEASSAKNMRVILAGAGTGGAGLITLKAAKAIKKARIIIYDSLIDKRLLKLAEKDTELIFAGKRRGRHSITQEKLNELLYIKAKTGKPVLRLKGGDPFIFGQGKEEFLYLKARGVKVKVIPGLTSAVAAPALAGISLTDREKLRSFTVLTGSFKNGKCEYNWRALKELEGAKVFLMGLANASHIADRLINAGAAPETPACIIENAGSKKQRHFNCMLGSLAQVCFSHKIKSPAVIVIGAESFF